MTTIDASRLLVDLIEDVGRLGGGTDEIVRAIMDDPRIAVVALPEPTARGVGGAAAPRFCRCGHSQRDHQADLFFCRAKVFTGVPCDCRGFVDEERIREGIRS